jgi:hypothetical protein
MTLDLFAVPPRQPPQPTAALPITRVFLCQAYLLQKPNPRDNRPLYKLYAGASNGECPIQIDTSTHSCGNPAQRD